MTPEANHFLLPVRHAMLGEAVRSVRFPCVLVAVSGAVGPLTANDDTEFYDAFERIAAVLSPDDHVLVKECEG